MADVIFLGLLFIHIATVVLWMGASILFVSVLGPSMVKLTGSSRTDLFKAIGPTYMRYVLRNATVAVAAGLILYAYISQSSTLAPSEAGMPWILTGILFGLAAYVIGIVLFTTNRKQMKLMGQASAAQQAPGAPSGEMGNMQRRMMMSAGIQALFLVIALLSMVIGANL